MQKRPVVRAASFTLGLVMLALLGAQPGSAADPTPTTIASPTPASTSGGSGIPLVTQQGYSRETAPTAPILLRQAQFQPATAGVSLAGGSVQHRRLPDREILRFTPDFAAPPDDNWEVVVGSGADLSAGTRIGPLKALTGTQEYEVPTGLEFTVVAVYNRERNQASLLAGLQPEPACAEVPARGSLALLRPQDAPGVCLPINTTDELNLTGTPPESVDLATYRLKVGGAVDKPLDLSFDDLRGMSPESEVSLLICSGVFADVTEWTGVSLATVLEAAGVKPGFRAVRLDGMDKYFTVLERKDVDPANVMLAYWTSGEPLPLKHGFPLRAVVKGDYGSKWVKWVREITVLDK